LVVDNEDALEGGVTVRVRLFAALREAAGASEVEVVAAPLGAVLDGLRARYGEPFADALRAASVLVDGQRCGDETALVPDGAEVALLPPFSGG
jgi:sulfur-carrier protein